MKKEKISPFWLSVRELEPSLSGPEKVKKIRKITKVSQASVSRWRSGIEPIGRKNLRLIARHYRCDIHWLETHDGNRGVASADDPLIVELSGVISDLTESDKDEILVNVRYKVERNRRSDI